MTKQKQRDFLDEHFLYEVEMFMYAYDFWYKAYDQNDIPNKNMGLECMLLHARSLLEFFSNKPKKYKDDVRAAEFAPLWTYSATQSFEKKMNKEISHLTYSRYKDTKNKEWNLSELYDLIAGLVVRFIRQLDPDYLTVALNTFRQSFESMDSSAGVFENIKSQNKKVKVAATSHSTLAKMPYSITLNSSSSPY